MTVAKILTGLAGNTDDHGLLATVVVDVFSVIGKRPGANAGPAGERQSLKIAVVLYRLNKNAGLLIKAQA